MNSQTKHSDNCKRVFKNYDMSCPRCKELSQGSKPRQGWQAQYFTKKAQNEKVWQAHLKSQHCNHNSTNAGGYCTICNKGIDFS